MKINPIGPLIRVVHKEFEQLHRKKAESMGLTSPQLFALHYLSKHQGEDICQRDIEKNFDLSHATVSGVIGRLENKGFIECRISQTDKRYKNILLTDKARCVETQMKEYIEKYEEQLMKGFSEDEKNQLREYLMRMLSNMNAEIPGR